MKVLVTGITGAIGGGLAPRLVAAGHEVRGLSRRKLPAALADVELVAGDAVTGAGLDEALDGVEVAYYLIHSMEPASAGTFEERELAGAARFTDSARRHRVRRIVYLGGLLPARGHPSRHLSSRLAVERTLLSASPESVAFRASIVIGARSRSFRLLVRLIERLPVLVLPAWQSHRTAPIDERDVLAYLLAAATSERVSGQSLDIAGPEVVTYGELVKRIRDAMLLGRPVIEIPYLTVTPVASRVSAVISGEQHDLIGPLMEGLDTDLLPRDDRVTDLLPLRRHSLDAAIERALRDWERHERLRAR